MADGTNILLPPDLAARLQRIVKDSDVDAADILRVALDALEAEDARKLEAARAKIQRSIDDPRPSVPLEEAFDRVQAKMRAKYGE